MKYECCGKERSKTGHSKHNRTVHKISMNIYRADYVCPKCNRKGESESQINEHLKECSFIKPRRYDKLKPLTENIYIYNNRI